jgi:hypothetical protein
LTFSTSLYSPLTYQRATFFIHSFYIFYCMKYLIYHANSCIVIGMVNKEAEMSDEQYDYYEERAYEAEQRFQDWFDREVEADLEPEDWE